MLPDLGVASFPSCSQGRQELAAVRGYPDSDTPYSLRDVDTDEQGGFETEVTIPTSGLFYSPGTYVVTAEGFDIERIDDHIFTILAE